jgi:TorA maturation chaperone TorD
MASNEHDRLDQALAFVGNSLLAPLSQTEQVGLDEDFWRTFPSFESPEVRAALDRMAGTARRIAASDDAVCTVSVEFTHLFVGPPRPAAAPWETAYRTDGHVGFGTATVEMQQRLERLNLTVSNENRQYADHVGLELLYLSELVRRADEGDEGCAQEAPAFAAKMGEWVPYLRERIAYEASSGYYEGIADVALALLTCV